MKKVMIVEDDRAIRQTVHDFLRKDGFTAVEVERGDEALDSFTLEKPDLIVLDLNLPGLDGVEICKQVRAQSAVPIIMLTARREEADQVIGLEVGADDYVVKPFSLKVLILKIRKLLDRPPLDDPQLLRFKDLEIDLLQHHVMQKGKMIDLTPVEFSLLVTLVQNGRRAFSRDELIDRVYDDFVPPDIFDRTIDTHVKNLRKKLGKGDYVRTVRGIGYQATEDS